MKLKLLPLDNSSDYIVSYKQNSLSREISITVSPDIKLFELVTLINKTQDNKNATNKETK